MLMFPVSDDYLKHPFPGDDGELLDGMAMFDEVEEKKNQIIGELFALPQFIFNVLYPCALTRRGRNKLQELERTMPSLFERPENTELLDTYDALHRTGLVEIDHCVKQMLTVFLNDFKSARTPEHTLSLVKASYPKIYGACKSAGEAISIGQLYLTLANIDPEEQETGIGEDMTSEGIYVLSMLFWVYGALQKPFELMDAFFAAILAEVIQEQVELYKPLIVPELSPEQKRFARILHKELNGKTVSCLQLLHSYYADEGRLHLYHCLYEAAGRRVDLNKRLEATAPLSDRELYHLVEMQAAMRRPLSELLVPYLVVKQSLGIEEQLTEELEAARLELATYAAKKAPEIPVDERLEQKDRELAELRAEVEQTKQALKTAVDRERGLTAELSTLRREISKRDGKIAAHKSDKRELAELREALYRISISRENGQEAEPEDDAAITFPYNDLPPGIVCFGGHEQWIGQMQKKLPGVRFVPINYRYDSNIIKRAPCVWIQPCYLSHKMYYRIISEARTAGVERHYFHSLSAISSAGQLVQTMNMT